MKYTLAAIVAVTASSVFAAEGRDPQNAWDAFLAGGEGHGKVEEVEPVANQNGTPQVNLNFGTITDGSGKRWTYTLSTKADDPLVEFTYTDESTGVSSGGMNESEASAFHSNVLYPSN